MSIEITKLIQDIAPYFKYENEAGATTQDQFQAFLKNLHAVVNCLASLIWQPETTYEVGHKIQSPNIPDGFIAIATTGGISGANEPAWVSGEVADGTVRWNVTRSDVTVNGNATNDDGDISIATVNHATKATNADVATKLGTATIGGAKQPMYLNEGVATAITDTVGSATKPIYMNGGIFTALSQTIGSSSQPVYMSGGVLTACSGSVGASNNGGIIAQSLGTNGYVKFANGLILQWGKGTTTGSSITISFPVSFSSTVYAFARTNLSSNSDYAAMNRTSIKSYTTTNFVCRFTESQNWWIAIGK